MHCTYRHPDRLYTSEVFQGAVLRFPDDSLVHRFIHERVHYRNEADDQKPYRILDPYWDRRKALPSTGPYDHPIVVLSRPREDPDHIVFAVMTTTLRKADRPRGIFTRERDYVAVYPSSPITKYFPGSHGLSGAVLEFCGRRNTRKSDVCINPIFCTKWRNCTRWKDDSGTVGGWALNPESVTAVLDHAKARLRYSPDVNQFRPHYGIKSAAASQLQRKNIAIRPKVLRT